jgi:apolipoprotein N-acyltransferase
LLAVALAPSEWNSAGRRTWSEGVKDLACAPLWIRLGWPIAGALIWVALEMIRARLMTGFPWNLLGASQYRVLPLVQISSLTGVYGLSFLLVWFSLSVVVAVAVLARRPQGGWAWMRMMMPVLLAVMAVATYGSRKLFAPEIADRQLTLALVQPSIPQTMIWDAGENARRFDHLLELSEQAIADGVDVLVWPEAGVPGVFRYDQAIHDRIAQFVRAHKVWLIFGGDDLTFRQGPRDDPNSYDAFNSSFLLDPTGALQAIYHKRRLVIFGEYVPLRRVLPFMKYLTPITGSFATGKVPVPFVMPALGAEVSVLICFEDVFPHLAREHVGSKTDFLLNLTNDGWFGESAAQWQQAANATFRAVENGVPLVRCTNNGLTCWIDSQGRYRSTFVDASGRIYGPGYQKIQVPVLNGQEHPLTFYGRWGDVFGWWCLGMSVLILIFRIVKR